MTTLCVVTGAALAFLVLLLGRWTPPDRPPVRASDVLDVMEATRERRVIICACQPGLRCFAHRASDAGNARRDPVIAEYERELGGQR